MSPGLCSVCGAILRDGACPNGHPQRAVRRGYDQPRRRRIFPWVLLILILTGAAYTVLIWVPKTAAGNLMRPSSEEFARAVEAYRGAVGALPPGATDPQVLADLAATAVSASGPAREELSDASVALTEREPFDVPIISSRPPLPEAISLRERMTEFYTGAQQALTSVEVASSYITQAAVVLPALASVEERMQTADPDNPEVTVSAAIPVADQLIADLSALTPPEELGGFHEGLLTIAQRIRDGLDAVANARGGEIGRPVVAATIRGVRNEIAAFRQSFGTAPRQARGTGLGPLLEEVDSLAVEITERLAALRDVHDLDGLTLPGE